MTDRRRDDRIFDHAYVSELSDLSIEELRERRLECDIFEAEVSFKRRLLQGRVDILSHELDRRSKGGEAGIDELRDKLPHILAPPQTAVNGRDSCGFGRHNRVVQPPEPEQQRREVDQLASKASLAHLADRSTDEIGAIVERLAEAEAAASDKRKKVQGVLDVLTAELVRRYKAGQEDPIEILKS
jgi:hypothetical protein